nr:pentatricopeptide repeat-containing protein At5g39680 [Ipomoea trifida]
MFSMGISSLPSVHQIIFSTEHTIKLLKTLADNKNLKFGKIIHALLIVSNQASEYYVVHHNSLISLYSRCGQLPVARHLFDRLPERNIVSWSAIMAGYFRSGFVDDVLELFKDMIAVGSLRPNEYVLSTVLSACSSSGLCDEGRQCHGYVVKSGLLSHQYVKNGLVSIYSISSDVEGAMRVLDSGSDNVTYNSFINGLLDGEYVSEALGILKRMVGDGLTWDNVTYVNAFGVCARLKNLNFGLQVHGKLLKSSVEFDFFIGSAIMDMYGKCGEIFSARKIFDSLQTRNVVSWTTLMAAYLQSECFEEALKMFPQMDTNGVLPNEYTFAVLLNACASLAALGYGNSLHARVEKTGYKDHGIVGNALINMYSKCGLIEAARTLFLNMVYRDTVTWNLIISGLSHHGFGEGAINMFKSMLASKEQPNYVTFIGVLSACGHSGQVDKGFYYLNHLMREMNIKPGLEHYTCVVGLLGKAGRLNEAENFMRSTSITWDVVAWRTLLNACHVHRNYDLGKRVAEFMLNMYPYDVGTYVLLSNMHARVKRWDGVARMRKLMRERNVKKEPGISWTEIKNNAHIFVSGDNMNPEIVQVHEKVRELLNMIKPLGYVPDIASDLHDVEEEQKEDYLRYHSEKLAIAYALMKTPPHAPVRVIKNLRTCDDCHSAAKLIAMVTRRVIIIRDANRFHRFHDGLCSCADYW